MIAITACGASAVAFSGTAISVVATSVVCGLCFCGFCWFRQIDFQWPRLLLVVAVAPFARLFYRVGEHAL